MNNLELIDYFSRCASVCNYCADACLKEDKINMLAECIRLDLDCAAICNTAAALLSRDSHLSDQIIEICERACRECAEECEKHSKMHDHCRECAEICRRCEEACKSYANV